MEGMTVSAYFGRSAELWDLLSKLPKVLIICQAVSVYL